MKSKQAAELAKLLLIPRSPPQRYGCQRKKLRKFSPKNFRPEMQRFGRISSQIQSSVGWAMSYEIFSLLALVVEAIKLPHVAMVVMVGMVLWMK